ncbi:MAG: MBL fold metallo-hydrolase [Clostridia bacterium]|nr:MBL fold metallo-hydrolase [Clostridia bacterium]
MSIEIKTVRCGDIMENAYLVALEGRDDCALIDPGDDAAKLKRALGDRRLSAMLLTHGHFDHILGAGALTEATGAPLYVAEADAEMLNDPALNGLESLIGGSDMPGPRLAARVYDEEVSVAGMAFEVIPTPGHSKGSVCLYLPDEGVLFSGDTLFRAGFGRMDLYGGSPMQMRDSLKRLFTLPPETRVYPGHGEPTTIGEERSRYRL